MSLHDGLARAEQTFSLSVSSSSSAVTGSFARQFVGFAFGNSAGLLDASSSSTSSNGLAFEAFTVYLLHRDSNVFALCPVVPQGRFVE